ncbi:centriole and centriolar satellite protein ofd1 [Lampris incognitus]|uniref:centriole and centriolar satellite protein ofd1 n=1 Tax=Lampris incognitus TaxID=2546036 RepID=UPI0024B60B00|nr:centriole and centriolar satellite protein ofd1 [Lampris incognitus]
MSAAKEEALSPDELRKKLYQTFKSRGVLNTLKTQLRNQLIQELKHPVLHGGDAVPRPVAVKPDSLVVSASNSIVADYLQSSGYEYTLSVFYPESGQSKDKIFTTEDVLQLLKISPESALYRSVVMHMLSHQPGFLISLLTQLADHHTQSLRCDADTQTTTISSFRESLVDKMKMIDQEYESLHYRGDKWVSYESKLAACRREIEAQAQAEMNTKMQHFKDVEIAKVKMEEKAKFHKEFEKLRQDMERTYELKTKELINREKNAIDRLQKQQEIEEKNVYMQRQAVLKEIEAVRNRENELKLRMEAFERTCEIHEKKVKSIEELLRRRELAVKTIEDTYDQKLKNELSRYELELKEEFIKRTEKLTENETRNKVESARIQKEMAVIDAKTEAHNKVCAELRRLQTELDTSQQQVSLLNQQKELLRERLETMSDYSTLKRDKVELQGQLRLLKKQLEEAQEENGLLRADSGKPSKEQLVLQMELRRLQSARRLDEEEFDNQKQVLQAQLQSEVEHCAQLRAQLTECEEKVRWMTAHAEEIKMQLRQTQQALENEVLRNPKPSLVDRSVLELTIDKMVPPDIYVDRALIRGRMGYDDVGEAGGPLRGHRSQLVRSSSPDSETELVAGAKARIRELEKEAEALEEAYRNYQQRAVHTAISHVFTPRPRSPQRAHPSRLPDSPQRRQIPHRSRPQSPQKPHVSPRPLSPQRQHATHRTVATSPSTYHTRTTSPTPQSRATFSEVQTLHREQSLQSIAEPPFMGDGDPQDGSSSPSRRPSSTPHSPSRKTKLQTKLAEEAVVAPASFPELSSQSRLSPVPHGEVVPSGDFPPSFTPPRSPQLQSTARDQRSPPKVEKVFSSSESSPQPEKISLEDLAETLSEPSHIPELLLDTAIPLSEEAPRGPSVPPPQAPRDLPDTQIPTRAQGDVPQTPAELARQTDEELRLERKEREERRQRELEEAKEREQKELERLEREMTQEVEQAGHDEEEEAVKEKIAGQGEEEELTMEEKRTEEKSHGGNPLDQYMKMVLEAREREQAQNPEREEPAYTSPEAKSLSEEKSDSIAAYSHEALDDDFW